MEKIMEFLNNFNPDEMLPDLNGMLGEVELILRLLVLAGPVVILVLGLCYLLLPPREANHTFGYRFYWGMSSVESWRFTQRLAGFVWSGLGLILTVVMLFICAGFPGMETMDKVWTAIRCVLWELGLLVAACVAIDVTVIVLFNGKGEPRRQKSSASRPSWFRRKALPKEE